MKPSIHPTWYPDAVVTCACGNTWTTGSTKKEIHTDVCSNCHPFFTGEQRIVDTAGQVERFMKRISAKEQIAAAQLGPEEKKSKKEKRRERKTGAMAETPVQQPPAELPLAVAQEPTPPVAPIPDTEAAPDPEAVEVAPLVEPENFKSSHDVDIAPAGEIGSAASVDKIIEPTGAVGTEEGGTAEAEAKPRAPRKSGARRASAKPKASEPNEPEEPKP